MAETTHAPSHARHTDRKRPHDRRAAGRAERGALRLDGRRIDSPWRIALRAVGAALTVVLVGLVLALVAVPLATGGQALTILTGSMTPALAPGDVAVVRGVETATLCADVRVGQIVSYFPKPDNPELITHRVIGKTIGDFGDGTACRLVVQGDANNSPDPPVSPKQVRGVFLFGLPKIGWALHAAQQHRTVVVGVAAALLAALALWSALRPTRRRIITTTTVVAEPNAQEPPP